MEFNNHPQNGRVNLTPNEYEEVIKLASVENQALGSTF